MTSVPSGDPGTYTPPAGQIHCVMAALAAGSCSWPVNIQPASGTPLGLVYEYAGIELVTSHGRKALLPELHACAKNCRFQPRVGGSPPSPVCSAIELFGM